jgi:hypothetical protein
MGLMLHTTAQHEPSSQPGFSWSSKQLPVHGQDHPLFAGTLQTVRAMSTQVVSHVSVQQAGSTEQVPLQQDESRQPAVDGCAEKQSPSAGQPPATGHTAVAARTQVASHAPSVAQHCGSTEQTAREHSSLEQAGVAWDSRQLPGPTGTSGLEAGRQRPVASRAQTASHRASQQNGSMVEQMPSQQRSAGSAANDPPLQPGR